MVRGYKALGKDLTAENSWSRRGGSNSRPADYESCAESSKINNFKQLGVQDAAKRDISCPKNATNPQPPLVARLLRNRDRDADTLDVTHAALKQSTKREKSISVPGGVGNAVIASSVLNGCGGARRPSVGDIDLQR